MNHSGVEMQIYPSSPSPLAARDQPVLDALCADPDMSICTHFMRKSRDGSMELDPAALWAELPMLTLVGTRRLQDGTDGTFP